MSDDESLVRHGVSGCETIEDSPVFELISYLVDCRDEDYTLTYDHLVEKAEEWLENNR